MSTRGGHRPGAGRKPKPEERVGRFTLTLKPEILAWLAANYPNQTPCGAVRQMIKERMTMTTEDFMVAATEEHCKNQPQAVLFGWAGKPWERPGDRATAVWKIGTFFKLQDVHRWEGPIDDCIRVGDRIFTSDQSLEAFLQWQTPSSTLNRVQPTGGQGL